MKQPFWARKNQPFQKYREEAFRARGMTPPDSSDSGRFEDFVGKNLDLKEK